MQNLFLTIPVKILTSFFYKIYEFLRYRTSLAEHRASDLRLRKYFSDLTVRSGPFKGMRYHSFNSTGSSLFPKLSGSYENELHPIIVKLFDNAYDQVIDIGCAEGYYAVGAALKFKNVPVFAFDLNAVAREQCAEMAQVNNVMSQVKILAQCTATWLYENCMNKHNLIICDCEGCERQLFGYQNIAAFSNSDLIVELHPMYHRDVRNFLYNLFFTTHEIYYVSSYDDNRKIFELPEEYDFMTGLDKLKLVQEGRSFSMDWMIAIAKNKKQI